MQPMLMHPLESQEDYLNAIRACVKLDDAYPSKQEHELLWLQIEIYERSHNIFDNHSPIDAIKYRMSQLGLKQKDLVPIIGTKGRVSDIVHGRRKINLEMIRRIYHRLHIPLNTLIQDYSLSNSHNLNS
jgi:HTH-type transcriptional regulator/antitoxin HigA